MVYSSLAPIYDRVMAHVEYGEWSRLISEVIRRYVRSREPAILEIGAGTGALGGMLCADGYGYTGSDRSYWMCREAARRDQRFACADGRALPFKGRFDLVLFLYDGINYLGSAADYDAVFREVHRCLVPGGLFLFDITTEANSRRYFCHLIDSEDYGDSVYIRRSYYDEVARVQHNEFTIFARAPDGAAYERSDEHHQQRVLPAGTIRAWIPDTLYEVVGMWDGFSLRRCHRSSERVHFLIRARGNA